MLSLFLMRKASLTKMLLSEISFGSSGKCQENHSLILIDSVFTSLSRSSNKAIDWMIGLSYLLTSREILFLEKAWERPSWALDRTDSSRSGFFKNLMKCALNPLISSRMTLLAMVWIPKASEIDPASLLSLTPNKTFSFFLTKGRFSLKKLVSSSVTLP